MNRRLSYIMMVILSLSLAAGCNQEVIQEESYGYLGINLANDLSEDIVVKAGTAADEKVFAVDVLNASGQLVAHADDHRTVTSADPIRLQIGNYDVVATNGTSQISGGVRRQVRCL